MEGDNVSKIEIDVHDGGQVNFAEGNAVVNAVQNNCNEVKVIKQKVKSRTQEYADKWNANMFLNDFDKRNENAGVNVKLSEVYLEENLPHYIWKENKKKSSNLKNLLSEYIEEKSNNKMLLIFGQPGIGKSTLITWITANLVNNIDKILIYKFASDLKKVTWKTTHGSNLFDTIFKELNLAYNELEGATVILDGFDEIKIEGDEAELLNLLYWKLVKNNELKNFTLIITCRENYVQKKNTIDCDYITLQPWDCTQIQSFCIAYKEKSKKDISDNMIDSIIMKMDIPGIPLIIYTILALNIVGEETSIIEIYDQIFSLKNGICDRYVKDNSYDYCHRVGTIKEQIFEIAKRVSTWIFENNSFHKTRTDNFNIAYIPYNEYKKICINLKKEYKNIKKIEDVERDFLIGSYFKLVKDRDIHEREETEKIYFLHNSIFTYFVSLSIYNSIEDSMIKLSENSQEELAGNLALYLMKGNINNGIDKYLAYRILRLYNSLGNEKKNRFYQWWESTINKMIDNGMAYYTKKNIHDYKNIIKREMQCFMNVICILRLLSVLSKRQYIMEYDFMNRNLEMYIQCYSVTIHSTKGRFFDLSKMFLQRSELTRLDFAYTNFEGANLHEAWLNGSSLFSSNLTNADLSYAHLDGAHLFMANLSGTNLEWADFKNANLEKSNLSEANLRRANLSEADLKGANLIGANLEEAIIDEFQVAFLEKKNDLYNVRVFLKGTGENISYSEYCRRKE